MCVFFPSSPAEELNFGSGETERKSLIILSNVTKNQVAFKVSCWLQNHKQSAVLIKDEVINWVKLQSTARVCCFILAVGQIDAVATIESMACVKS